MKRQSLLVVLLLIIGLNAGYATPEKQTKVTFSRAYTDLKTQCGSGLTPREEREAAEHGQDIPSVCKGFGGYEIFIASHGMNTQLQVRKKTTKRVKDVVISEEAGDGIFDRKVEWRMANGKPFAVIFRVDVFAENDDPLNRKKVGEALRIIGLNDERINFEVEVKTTPNPNEKARQLADQAFSR